MDAAQHGRRRDATGALAFTASGGANEQTLYGYEVAGLGSSPQLDKSSTGSGNSAGPLDSGSTGSISFAPEIILGTGVGYALNLNSPGSPWISQVGTVALRMRATRLRHRPAARMTGPKPPITVVHGWQEL